MKTMLKLASAPAVLGFALTALPAYAQDASDEADEGATIVVTGSRLASPNLESASPVTVVTAEEIKGTGTTRVEDLVNSLPQVFAGQGSNYSNGSSGTATLNLRGLGSARGFDLTALSARGAVFYGLDMEGVQRAIKAMAKAVRSAAW